ncbi:thioredoxin family protein [Pontibacter liquoris]|uniref:thioredoxin family protein n=1 Tax=Pontibacter liquoris TaxID=2905677 RepID=UPI001FA76DC8|nr:thioredoxin family protein [Pontibacter liquoris]
MNIIESNDEELRRLIFERDKVIVKFIDEHCPVCKRLAPGFTNMAAKPAYQNITFVRMHAKENPVSSQEVKMTGTPFFATYKNGTLLDCGIVSTEDALQNMLQKLL